MGKLVASLLFWSQISHTKTIGLFLKNNLPKEVFGGMLNCDELFICNFVFGCSGMDGLARLNATFIVGCFGIFLRNVIHCS